MEKHKTILMAVPFWGHIEPQVETALMQISNATHAPVFKHEARPTDFARNTCVRAILKNKEFDWLFFVDSDTQPPLDVLDRLRGCNHPVVSGCYRLLMKSGLKWAVSNKNDQGKYILMDAVPNKPIADAPFDADGCGAGCLLIHRNVLQNMPWPWFRWEEFQDGSQTSEDVYFCKKLNAAGVKVRIDPSVVCVHHKTIGI